MPVMQNVKDYFNPPFVVVDPAWAKSSRKSKLINSVRLVRSVQVNDAGEVTGVYITEKDILVPKGAFQAVSKEPWRTANRFILPTNIAASLKAWDKGQGVLYNLDIAAKLQELDLGVEAFKMTDDFAEAGVVRDVDISACGIDIKVPYYFLFPVYDPSLKKVSLDNLIAKVNWFLQEAKNNLGSEVVAYAQDYTFITKETFQGRVGFTIRRNAGEKKIVNLSKVMQFLSLEEAKAAIKKDWE